MTDLLFLNKVKQISMYRIAGEGLKRQWRDKMLCAVRHDDMHIGFSLDQQAQNLGCLVSGNAATDSQNDRFCLQHSSLPFA